MNPWKSRTPEEAWAIIAKGIDQALGLSSSFPTNWAKHPFLTWLSRLLPIPGISSDLIRVLDGDSSDAKERLIRRINRSLDVERNRILVFVDDMERTDSKILKSLFPVIDQLGNLKNCYFVFAIDPERIAEAFGEKGKSGTETKGYLDKVFDLQVILPEPRQKDIAHLFGSLVNTPDTPKLAAAFPTIRELIPTNPRQALLFFHEARAKEILFLSRYGPREEPFIPFFVFWLCEVEFRGFAEAILESKASKLFGAICEVPTFSRGPENIPKNENFPKLITQLLESLKQEHPPTHVRQRLEDLVEFLAARAGGTLTWLASDAGRFRLEWAAHGYAQLLELASEERKQLYEYWTTKAGKESVETMLKNSLGHMQYCEPSRCAEQLIETEVESVIADTRAIFNRNQGSTQEKLNGVLTRIERLRVHLRYSKDKKLPFDLALYSEDLFGKWLKYIDETPLGGIDSSEAGKVMASRESLHLEMAKLLTLGQSWLWGGWKIHTTVERYARQGDRSESQAHCEMLKKVLRAQVTEGVFEMFRVGTIPDNWPPPGISEQLGINFFYDPANWLWLGDENWKALLTEFSKEAQSNPKISTACSELARTLFLHPLACSICAENHSQERRAIQKLAQDHPEYLEFFWGTAMVLPPENPERLDLMTECQDALRANGGEGFVPIDLIRKHFPLPEDSAGGA